MPAVLLRLLVSLVAWGAAQKGTSALLGRMAGKGLPKAVTNRIPAAAGYTLPETLGKSGFLAGQQGLLPLVGGGIGSVVADQALFGGEHGSSPPPQGGNSDALAGLFRGGGLVPTDTQRSLLASIENEPPLGMGGLY